MKASEASRLVALADYGVLDTPPEEAFDRLTRLASDLFDAPIALISLVDEDRQWFKSRHGVEVDQTPRSWAFCAHAIEQSASSIMVIEDARLDPRFTDNPFVASEGGFRFYMGAVLTDAAGHNLGALCVIDYKPRPAPCQADLERLRALAAIVVDELALHRATRAAIEKQAQLELAEAGRLKASRQAEEQARRAEASAGAKAEFLANMSHELRTPLTSIIGFTRLAAQQSDLSEETRAYVDRVAEASRALLCTVNDILDLSRLEAGKVRFRVAATPLAALCRAALALLAPLAEVKGLALSLECAPAAADLNLKLDPDRIRQILLNLVGNALKFTEAGAVVLRVDYDALGERLAVEVTDTGPGIPADKVGVLFKRFSQVDGSRGRAHGGSGLGLAICKGLVEAMGGEIGVDSRFGEGSRFWFAIPAPLASRGEPDRAAASEPLILEGLKVLVVDDHAANRELAHMFLSTAGAEVSEASGGEAAAELATKEAFDVILMDLRMPGLDGVGALRRIRERRGPNAETAIVAFTADVDEGAAERLTAIGFQGLVGKPMEPLTLIGAVARASVPLTDERCAVESA
jgi:YD repeat-containing protein